MRSSYFLSKFGYTEAPSQFYLLSLFVLDLRNSIVLAFTDESLAVETRIWRRLCYQLTRPI